MSESRSVRCVDCGFFAARRPGQYDPIEMPEEHREKRFSSGFSSTPCCVKRLEVFGLTDGRDSAEHDIEKMMRTERICNGFMEWRPGFSPKEHAEIEMQHLVEESRRLWEEKQAIENDKRHRETIDIALRGIKQSSKDSRINTTIAFVCGLIGAAATLGVVFLERWSSTWK